MIPKSTTRRGWPIRIRLSDIKEIETKSVKEPVAKKWWFIENGNDSLRAPTGIKALNGLKYGVGGSYGRFWDNSRGRP